jgi:hypothetical protein
MIAVEVGVSQSYEILRAAISWSVWCALHCRLVIAMCIREQGRGRTPDPPQYSSIQVENAAVDEADQDFRHQLTERPYRPMVRDSVAWFWRIKLVVLETYRIPDEDVLPETLLQPSRSFVSDSWQYLWTMPANLQKLYRRLWRKASLSAATSRQTFRSRPRGLYLRPHLEWRGDSCNACQLFPSRLVRGPVQRRNGEYSLQSHAAKA